MRYALLMLAVPMLQMEPCAPADPTPTPTPLSTPTPTQTPGPGVCVFGPRYHDVLLQRSQVLVDLRNVRSAETLTAAEQAQLVYAANAAGGPTVTTAAEALASVDQDGANFAKLWDITNDTAWDVVEFARGDTSLGQIFVSGQTTSVARINDGDIYDCQATQGPHGTPCRQSGECATDHSCVGVAYDYEADVLLAPGLCIANARPTSQGLDCTTHAECGQGARCSGLTRGPQGLCDAASTAGTFYDEGLEQREVGAAGLELVTVVYGLTTVDTDVSIELFLVHPDVRDVRVTLTNPATTEAVVVAQGSRSGGEIVLRGASGDVRGFSGDEGVQGSWTLRVEDVTGAQRPEIYDYALRVGSRWD